VHRLGAACDRRAQPGQARRPDPPHALGGLAGAGRGDRQRRSAAAFRLRLGVAAAAKLPFLRACRTPGSTWWCRWRPRWWLSPRWPASPWSSSTASSSSARCASPGSRTHDAGGWEAFGLVWLALITLLLGILPVDGDPAHRCRDAPVARHGPCRQAGEQGWWMLAPISPERASYEPLIFLSALRPRCCSGAGWCAPVPRPGAPRSAWDCGYYWQGPRMQDTAEGFSQPIRRSSSRCSACSGTSRPRATASPITASRSRTISGTGSTCRWPAGRQDIDADRHLAGGRIAVYLMYSFITLLILLVVDGHDNIGSGPRNCSPSCWRWCWRRCSAAGSTSAAPGCKPSAPPLLQPYYHAAQAVQQGRGAGAARLVAVPRRAFRRVRLHGAGLRHHSHLSTDLPLAPAADAIALVGLFALARVFISLAAMDVGTSFGTFGARREMLIGFLAEPALLMVLFSAGDDLASRPR
jgi:hypothetical protein